MKKEINKEKAIKAEELRAHDMWDTRKHIAFKRKRVYTVLNDETKVRRFLFLLLGNIICFVND